jgi:hypothetical protein
MSEWWIGNDVEGSNSWAVLVVFHHLSGKTEEATKTSVNIADLQIKM